MDEQRAELLRLVKGSPQPEVSIQGLAERIGISIPDAGRLVDELVAEGRLRREDDRLLVVEPAASAQPDEPLH